MNDTVPFGVRLTVETGLCCCPVSDLGAWAEKLLGHPIWTHEFGMEETWDDLRIALAAWDEELQYHPGRSMSPVASLFEMMKDNPKPVIVVNP